MIKKLLLGIVVLTLILIACERDDICATTTPTTPQLVIKFYDVANTTEPKPIVLAVNEMGNEDTMFFAQDTVLRVPLRTNEEVTQFNFIKNPGGETQNTDVVTFNYETNELYISRACGFRISYDNLSAITTPSTDGRWIEDLQIESQTILDEETTHVSIYH